MTLDTGNHLRSCRLQEIQSFLRKKIFLPGMTGRIGVERGDDAALKGRIEV